MFFNKLISFPWLSYTSSSLPHSLQVRAQCASVPLGAFMDAPSLAAYNIQKVSPLLSVKPSPVLSDVAHNVVGMRYVGRFLVVSI